VSRPGHTVGQLTTTAGSAGVAPGWCVGGGEGTVEAGGDVVTVDVEVGEAALEERPSGRDRVEAIMRGVKGDEPAVGLLGVAVQVDDPLQGVDGGVGMAGVVFELGQAQVGIEGPAMQVLADQLDPGVVAARQQVAPVGVDRSAQCLAGRLVVGGSGGLGEGTLEVPQIAGDLRRVGPVMLADLLRYVEGLAGRTQEVGAQVVERVPELVEHPVRRGVGPERVDDLDEGGVLGAEQAPGQERLRPTPQPGGDRLAEGGGAVGAEHLDDERPVRSLPAEAGFGPARRNGRGRRRGLIDVAVAVQDGGRL